MSAISLFSSVASIYLCDHVTHNREWVEMEYVSVKRDRGQMKWNRKLKGQKPESPLKGWEKCSRCVYIVGERGCRFQKRCCWWWQRNYSGSFVFSLLHPPSGRLDDNFISAKFLHVVHLIFSTSFSLTSLISIPLHTASPSLQDPFPPSRQLHFLPSHRPRAGGAGTLAHLILSPLQSW